MSHERSQIVQNVCAVCSVPKGAFSGMHTMSRQAILCSLRVGTDFQLPRHCTVHMQTHETRAEMQEIMMVPKNIVSAQANKPVIGIVQVSRWSAS